MRFIIATIVLSLLFSGCENTENKNQDQDREGGESEKTEAPRLLMPGEACARTIECEEPLRCEEAICQVGTSKPAADKTLTEEEKALAKEKAEKLADARMKATDKLFEDDPAEKTGEGMRAGITSSSTSTDAPSHKTNPFAGASGPLGSADSGGLVTVGRHGSGSARAADGLSKRDIGGDVGFKKLDKEKKVRIKFDKPSVSKNYDPEWVRRVIRSHKGQIKWCYQISLTRNPDLAGKVVLAFKIAPDGSLKNPSIVNHGSGMELVGECLARKSIRWKFQIPPDGSVVKVTYPFFFKSN